MAARPVTVHEIVMEQGEVVDQLHGSSGVKSHFRGRSGRLSRQHGQDSAYALAARPIRLASLIPETEVVPTELAYAGVESIEGAPQRRLDQLPAVAECVDSRSHHGLPPVTT